MQPAICLTVMGTLAITAVQGNAKESEVNAIKDSWRAWHRVAFQLFFLIDSLSCRRKQFKC
jgi:hypothetical protein